MNDNELDKLYQWAHTSFGLVLREHQKESFRSHVKTYLKTKNLTIDRCLHEIKLNQSLSYSTIEQDLIDLLTIQESYFFRDQSLFVFLKYHYLPALIKKKHAQNDKRIKLWSAGCSTGEELYSLAILLVELIPDLEHWKLELIGTDINHKALHQAEVACYSKLALRATDEQRKNHYFSEVGSQFSLIPSIKKMTKFGYGNLADLPDPDDFFDLIFCRNVFIYLDEAIIYKALLGFEQRLTQNGALFLGPSDFIFHQKHPFVRRAQGGVIYFERLYADSAAPIPEKKIAPSYIEQQKQRTEQVQAIKKLLETKHFEQALIEGNKMIKLFNTHSLLYRYKGEALIGLGDLPSAKDALEQAIQKDAMDPKAYFLLALVFMEEDFKRTEVALNKALYLKQDFVEARYHLAMLYFGEGLVAQGVKHLKKAKSSAEQENKDRPVIGYDGSIGDLLEVIHGELQQYLEY